MLVDWLVGWLVRWFVGSLVRWFVGGIHKLQQKLQCKLSYLSLLPRLLVCSHFDSGMVSEL